MDSDSTGDESTQIIGVETAVAETIAGQPQQAASAPVDAEVTEVVAVAEPAQGAVTEVVAVAPTEVVPVSGAATEVVAAQVVAAAAPGAAPVEQAYAEAVQYAEAAPYPQYAAAVPFDAGYGEAVAPGAPAPGRRNVLALLGLILAVPVWPAGLVLSTLELLNAFTRRTGKVVAVIGLVLSAVVGGAVIAELAQATSTVSASTALDEGCENIEAKLPADLATLKADTATLTSNKDSASSSNSSIETVSGDVGAIGTDLTSASGQATHADVVSDLNKMNAQLQAFSTTLSDIQNHSTSSEGATAAALTTLSSTDADLDALCSSY